MRMYMVVYDEGTRPLSVTFLGTQAEQKALEKQIHNDGNRVVRSCPVDMPDDKAGRIEWLNTFQAIPEDEK